MKIDETKLTEEELEFIKELKAKSENKKAKGLKASSVIGGKGKIRIGRFAIVRVGNSRDLSFRNMKAYREKTQKEVIK